MLVLFSSGSLVTAADEVQAKTAPTLYLGLNLFAATIVVNAFLLSEKIDHHGNFESIKRERLQSCFSDKPKGIKKSTHVSKEVKNAISLSLPYHHILVYFDIDACVLESVVRLFIRGKVRPRCWLRSICSKRMKV